MEKATLHVKGMSCGHCVKAVETSVGALEGVSAVQVHLADEKVDVCFDPTVVTLADIKETIDDQGYDVE